MRIYRSSIPQSCRFILLDVQYTGDGCSIYTLARSQLSCDLSLLFPPPQQFLQNLQTVIKMVKNSEFTRGLHARNVTAEALHINSLAHQPSCLCLQRSKRIRIML